MMINWDYNLEDPNALRSIDFSYLDDKGKRVYLAYKRKGQNFSFYQNLQEDVKNNFIIEVGDASVARLTFKNVLLNYNNTKFTFDIHLQSGTEVSSHVTLIILGKLNLVGKLVSTRFPFYFEMTTVHTYQMKDLT